MEVLVEDEEKIKLAECHYKEKINVKYTKRETKNEGTTRDIRTLVEGPKKVCKGKE